MPADTPVTKEGETYIMKCWFDTLVAANLSFYAITSPLTADVNTYTYADLEALTDPTFKNTAAPESIIFGSGSTLDGDPFPTVRFTNWRCVNGTGVSKTVYGLLVCDDVAEKVMLINTTPGNPVIGAGVSFAYDITLWLDASADPNP